MTALLSCVWDAPEQAGEPWGEGSQTQGKWVTQLSLNLMMSDGLIRALTFVLCCNFSSETNAHVGPCLCDFDIAFSSLQKPEKAGSSLLMTPLTCIKFTPADSALNATLSSPPPDLL